MLDLRTPSGLFFLLTGLLLIFTSIFSPQSRAALSEVNVNLYCGLFMVAFGSLMLLLAWQASRIPNQPAGERSEGPDAKT